MQMGESDIPWEKKNGWIILDFDEDHDDIIIIIAMTIHKNFMRKRTITGRSEHMHHIRNRQNREWRQHGRNYKSEPLTLCGM